MIGLPKRLPEQDPQYDLHRLLTALLSMDLTADEKMSIISNEYDIAAESGVGKETLIMFPLKSGQELPIIKKCENQTWEIEFDGITYGLDLDRMDS